MNGWWNLDTNKVTSAEREEAVARYTEVQAPLVVMR